MSLGRLAFWSKMSASDAPPPWRLLEEDQPLSRSLLWRLQREFFESRGIAAWSDGIVPSFITSNAWMAEAYAEVALGWLRDAAASGGGAAPAVDPQEPLYLVELGSGSGRFGYLFATRLLELLDESSLPQLDVRYVFADAAEGNLAFLRAHPSLAPLVAAGRVDFARFDAAVDAEMELQVSGDRLAPGALRNPLVVVANYLFDTIPHDAFSFRDGGLFECAVTVRGGREGEDLEPDALPGLEISWRDREASLDYYGDPELDAILREYAARLRGSTLLFPCAGLRCLGRMASWSGDRLLLLSADKGYCHEALLDGLAAPELTHHGSFSLMVNYHAIGRWFRRRGGGFLHGSRPRASLKLTAGLLGIPQGGARETRAAFAVAMERGGPDDLFVLKQGIDQVLEGLDLEHLLAWLRLAAWEPKVLLAAFPRLVSLAGSASDLLRQELFHAVHEVWKAHFPLPEREDLAFSLGVLLCEIRCYEEALGFLRISLASFGDNAATLFNLGLCLFHLGDRDGALACSEAALAAESGFAPAAELRARILTPAAPEPAGD